VFFGQAKKLGIRQGLAPYGGLFEPRTTRRRRRRRRRCSIAVIYHTGQETEVVEIKDLTRQQDPAIQMKVVVFQHLQLDTSVVDNIEMILGRDGVPLGYLHDGKVFGHQFLKESCRQTTGSIHHPPQGGFVVRELGMSFILEQRHQAGSVYIETQHRPKQHIDCNFLERYCVAVVLIDFIVIIVVVWVVGCAPNDPIRPEGRAQTGVHQQHRVSKIQVESNDQDIIVYSRQQKEQTSDLDPYRKKDRHPFGS